MTTPRDRFASSNERVAAGLADTLRGPGLSDRFWAKVDTRSDNECWTWLGHVLPHGYGTMYFYGATVSAHVVAKVIQSGSWGPGLDVDHLCRVRACVNPRHLEVVTRAENNRRGLLPSILRERGGAVTRCPQGHIYSEENTYTYEGQRQCRICMRARSSRKAVCDRCGAERTKLKEHQQSRSCQLAAAAMRTEQVSQ